MNLPQNLASCIQSRQNGYPQRIPMNRNPLKLEIKISNEQFQTITSVDKNQKKFTWILHICRSFSNRRACCWPWWRKKEENRPKPIPANLWSLSSENPPSSSALKLPERRTGWMPQSGSRRREQAEPSEEGWLGTNRRVLWWLDRGEWSCLWDCSIERSEKEEWKRMILSRVWIGFCSSEWQLSPVNDGRLSPRRLHDGFNNFFRFCLVRAHLLEKQNII